MLRSCWRDWFFCWWRVFWSCTAANNKDPRTNNLIGLLLTGTHPDPEWSFLRSLRVLQWRHGKRPPSAAIRLALFLMVFLRADLRVSVAPRSDRGFGPSYSCGTPILTLSVSPYLRPMPEASAWPRFPIAPGAPL